MTQEVFKKKLRAHLSSKELKMTKCILCPKYACYGKPGVDKTNKYCGIHKEVGMINLKFKKCVNCPKNAFYNKRGEKVGKFCRDHKEVGMINTNTKRCKSCDKSANFNYKGLPRKFCKDHKEENMVNVSRIKSTKRQKVEDKGWIDV